MSKENIKEIIIENGVELAILAEAYRDMQTDGPWYKIGEKGEKDLTDQDRETLLQNSRDRYWKTPEGRSLIAGAVHYIIGRGIVYHSEDENPLVQQKLDEFWKHSGNLMELRQKETVTRTLRDGEAFLRFFTDQGTGVSFLRFVEPEQIKEIEKDPNDAETVLRYKREWTPAGETTVRTEIIDADDIVHIKLFVDMNAKRGRPYIENVIKRLVQLDQFIEGRVRRNRISAGHILEKIIKGKGGTAESVSSITSGMSDATKDTGVGTASKKMPKIGSVVVHNEAIEYKWCEPKIAADDCKEDARLIKLSICSGVNAPEFVLSDASNANYASTLVSENPYVRSIEDLQDTFEVYFQIIFSKVIERLIKAKAIPATSTETQIQERWILKYIPFKKLREALQQDLQKEIQTAVPTKTSVTIEFPQMIHKELLQDTQAYQIHDMQGWADASTIAGKLGYNYDEEQEKVRKRREQEPEDEDGKYADRRDEKLKDEEGKE